MLKKLLLTFLFCSIFTFTAQSQNLKISTEDDIKNDINAVVCKNEERLEAVKKLFLKAGVAESDVKIEKIKSVENLLVTKKGKSEETIIIGAHYDKVSEGCGAIDNWTGIVILANLYRTMKDVSTEKTYVFAAFGKEELGLLGSNEMARSIPKEKREGFCAMINFDSFGFAYPQAMSNISDAKLVELAKETSKELNIPFANAAIENASSDSDSFRQQKIPGITLHGMSNNWKDYLHTGKDKVENVNVKSVYVGYRYALIYAAKVDAKPCAEFRK